MVKEIEVKVKANVDPDKLDEFKATLDEISNTNYGIDFDTSGIDGAKDSTDEFKQSTDESKGASEENAGANAANMDSYVDLSSAIHDVIGAAESFINEIWSYIDAAGSLEDTNNRIADTFGMVGESGLDSTSELGSAVSDLSDKLGITKGEAKSVLDNLSLFGINTGNMEGVTQGFAGLAYILGTDVPGAVSAAQRSIQMGTVRFTGDTGKMFTALAKQKNMSQEEFKEYFKGLDEQGRLALFEAFGRSEQGKEYAKKYSESWGETKKQLDATWSKIEAGIGKALKPIFDALIPIIDLITEAKDTFDDWTGGASNYALAALILAGAIIGIGIALYTLIPALMGAAAGFLAVTVAGAPLWAIVLAITAIALALVWLYNNNKEFKSFIDGIGKGLGDAFNWLMEVLGKIQSDLEAVFAPLIQAWNDLYAAFQPVRDALNAFFSGGEGSAVIDTLTMIGEGLIQFMLMPIRMIIGVVVPLLTFLLQFITILVQLATGQITFQQAVSQVWNSIKQLVTNVLKNIANSVPTVITNIVNYFKGLPAKIMSAISSLRDQFLNYFINLATEAWKSVTNVFGGGGNSGDVTETLKTGYGLTSAQIINQYGLLDLDSGMDAIEKINKGINRRDNIRSV